MYNIIVLGAAECDFRNAALPRCRSAAHSNG